jgi:hypothetical protein
MDDQARQTLNFVQSLGARGAQGEKKQGMSRLDDLKFDDHGAIDNASPARPRRSTKRGPNRGWLRDDDSGSDDNWCRPRGWQPTKRSDHRAKESTEMVTLKPTTMKHGGVFRVFGGRPRLYDGTKPQPKKTPEPRRAAPPARGAAPQCKLDCKRVYFGTELFFGAGIVVTEQAINLEWKSQLTGNFRQVAIMAGDIESIAYKTQDDADAGPIDLAGDDAPADLSDGGPVVKFLALTLDKKARVGNALSRERFDPSQNPGPHCRVVLDLGGSAARVFTDEVLGFLFDNYWLAVFTMISGADAAAPYLLGVTDANAMEKRRRAKQDELEPAAKRRRQPPPAAASDDEDCVVVGSRSAEDRDEELRRAAISVDDSDAEEQTSMPEPARTLESHLKELRDGLGPSGGFDVAVALTWCEENGADELSEIAEVDMVDDFVASLELKPVKAKKLKEKLRAL